MKDSSGQWVIKLQSDQVKGPYSTDAVRKMIINGAFSGNEEISSYPDGEWQSLTKQPEFYDALLESLENPVEVDIKKAQKMEAETVVRVLEQKKEALVNAKDIPLPTIQNLDDLKAFMDGELQVKENTNIAVVAPDEKKPPSRTPATVYPKNELVKLSPAEENFLQNRNKNLDIQMMDIQKLKQNEVKKLVPFLLVLMLLAAGVIYYFYPKAQDVRAGWILIAPKKTSEMVSPEEAKNLKRRAVRAFQSGVMEQLLAAQPGLVQSVESSPKDLEGMALLCMMYEQLWPYSKQTQEDFKSITTVTQMVRSVNPISNYSDSCQAVFMLTKGQNKEARSLIGKVLDNPSPGEKFSLAPILYLLQGEILEGESNFINAAAYYEQASKLWPEWITAKFGLARMYYKQNLFSESREQYQAMYNANKESKAALFGLGLVETKGSKNIDKAITFFANGFSLKQALPKDFLTESLLNYAQILLDKNDPKTALVVALEGYHVNPSHRGLKELVISLGGDEKVENAQSEIMLIGDQFARAGDHMVAQAQYKAAFEVDSKNALAAFKAAKSLWQINQTRDAIVWLEKSINADPKMLQAYVLKADYESQKYNFAGAAKTIMAASRRFPRSYEVIKTQALLEFRKNNMTGAIQYGERAVKMYNADVELLTMLVQAHIYYYLNASGT
jgi:tetratricopeptide (TPR) repeat protein